nr:MAG TPA: hypothetical protein [Caudoviricetes sp.]
MRLTRISPRSIITGLHIQPAHWTKLRRSLKMSNGKIPRQRMN